MDPAKIKQCISGDRKAQKELYEMYKITLFVLCQRYLSDRDEAQDVLQDGFIKIFRDLYQFDETKGQLIHWMKKVMINTCLEKIRKRKLSVHSIDDNISNIGYESDILSDLSLYDITKWIQKLPLGYRTVFNLYAIEGYSHSDIGSQLGISESTSKTQYMKARNMLKGFLEVALK